LTLKAAVSIFDTAAEDTHTMSGRNFSLTDHLSSFVDDQVASGRHQNASEVVREALRRYQDDMLEEQAGLAALERVAQDGIAAIERGDFTVVRDPADSRRLVEDWNARAAERITARTGGNPPRRG
jgi:antitoxin ParD1/3/4